MTHKKAKEIIEQLRDLIQDRKSHIKCEEYSDIYKQDIEALQFGINAIEQSEKGETAHWDINCNGYYPFCSACNATPKANNMSPYCPYCGAKMITRE